MRSFIFN